MTSEDSDGFLQEWSDVIRESGEQMRRKADAEREELGEPDAIETVKEIETEYGYWRVEGGVVCYTRRIGGRWQMHTRDNIPEERIKLLGDLLNKEPRR